MLQYSSILFAILSLFAFQYDLLLDTVLLGTLAFLSFINHSKLIRLPIMFHVLDKLYAHIFAVTYAVLTVWYALTTKSMMFVLSLALGLLASAIYYLNWLPHICVHILVFVAGVAYLLGRAGLESRSSLQNKSKDKTIL